MVGNRSPILLCPKHAPAGRRWLDRTSGLVVTRQGHNRRCRVWACQQVLCGTDTWHWQAVQKIHRHPHASPLHRRTSGHRHGLPAGHARLPGPGCYQSRRRREYCQLFYQWWRIAMELVVEVVV